MESKWLFIGGYPNATVYADKRKEDRGDYHHIVDVVYEPLKLNIHDNSSQYKEVIEMAQEELNERKGIFKEENIKENTPDSDQSDILRYKGIIAKRQPSSHTQGSIILYKDGEVFKTYSLEAEYDRASMTHSKRDGRENPYFMTDGEVRELIDTVPSKMEEGGSLASNRDGLESYKESKLRHQRAFEESIKNLAHEEFEKGGEITAKYIGDDDWSRKLYKGTNGKIYADVDGVLHYITDEGEPLYPARNVKIVASDVPELSDDEKFKNMMADRDRQMKDYEENQLPRLKAMETGGGVKIDEDKIAVRVLTDNGFVPEEMNSIIFEDKPNMLIGTAGTKGKEQALVFIVGGEYHPDESTLITKEHLREILSSFYPNNIIHIFTNAGVELHTKELKQNEWKNLKIHKIGEGYTYANGGTVGEKYKRGDFVFAKIMKDESIKIPFIVSHWSHDRYYVLGDGSHYVKEENLSIANEKDFVDYYGQDVADSYIKEFKLEKGGGFDKLARKVAGEYKGDKVAKKYQSEYGKRYDPEEALEVGRKVAAKVYRQQLKNKGGK